MADKIITLEWEGKSLTYTLVRKQVKNINLRVRPDGIVKVSAPHRIKKEDIDAFVMSKYDFITDALEQLKERRENAPENITDEVYKDGIRLVYLGDIYTLRIEKGSDDDVSIRGKEIVATTIDTENTVYVKKLVKNWYFNRTAELFRRLNDETYEMFSQYYRVPKAKIERKTLKSRWGCCYFTEGRIVMNDRLIYYPEMSVRYVFIHEYSHFIEHGHGRGFYRVADLDNLQE